MSQPIHQFDLSRPSSYRRPGPSLQAEDYAALMVEAIPPTLLPGRVLAAWEKRFVCECVKVLVQLFHLHGFDSTGYSTRGTLDHWMLLASHCGNALSFMKYKLAAFYSVWKGQELPTSPYDASFDNPRVLLGGRCCRWINLLSQNHGSRHLFESLLTSVLFSKKGMPRPGDELLRAAEIKTYNVLTTLQNLKPSTLLPWGDITDRTPDIPLTLDKQTFIQQLKRTVQEIFRGKTFSREDRIRPFFPSTSANYINSRNRGGAVGVILHDPALLDGLKSREPLVGLESAGTSRARRVVVDTEPLFAKFEVLYDRILEKARLEEPVAEPLALPEALKVRVITKGPPYMATAMKPLQKFLWRTVRNCRVGELIGTPVTARIVQDKIGKALKSDEAFLSIDYEAATDNLQSWVSETIAEAISEEIGLSDVEKEIFLNSLTRHILQDAVSGVKKPQKNGQLMGSVTSFPILCIANITVCRWTAEVDQRKIIHLKDAMFCVNGDDAVMRATKRGKEVWEKISAFGGLKPSVGKVYFSREFLNINSTTYRFSDVYPFSTELYLRKEKNGSYTEASRPLYFELVHYINLGLLKGIKRSGGDVDNESIGARMGGLGARARDLISSSPPPLREKVMSAFIHNHSKLLREARVPWFLPERVGGLGLPVVGRWSPSDRELRLARKILESNLKVPKKPVDGPWKVWQYATDRYRTMASAVSGDSAAMLYEWSPALTSKDALKQESTTSEMTTLGMLCVESLFRVKRLKDLYEPKKEKSGYLDQLRKLWKKVRVGVYPEPLNLDRIPKTLDFSEEATNTLRKADLRGHLTTQMGNGDIAFLTSLFAGTQLSEMERAFVA